MTEGSWKPRRWSSNEIYWKIWNGWTVLLQESELLTLRFNISKKMKVDYSKKKLFPTDFQDFNNFGCSWTEREI